MEGARPLIDSTRTAHVTPGVLLRLDDRPPNRHPAAQGSQGIAELPGRRQAALKLRVELPQSRTQDAEVVPPGLLLGFEVESDLPIHVVCSPKDEYLAIITAYRPDAEQWTQDFRRRL